MIKDKKQRKGLSYNAKENLKNAGFCLGAVAVVSIAPICMWLNESDYKYQLGDQVTLIVGNRVGTVSEVNYTSDGDVPKYDIRILDEAGKPSELEYYETEIKGLVKKIN